MAKREALSLLFTEKEKRIITTTGARRHTRGKKKQKQENEEEEEEEDDGEGEEEGLSTSRSLSKYIEEKKAAESECTFKPQINKESSKLEGRGFTALTTSEISKLNTKREMLLRDIEKEQKNIVTFQPKLISNDLNVEGKIKILSEPSTYIERMKQEKENINANLIKKVTDETDEKNMLTFVPEIHKTPQFVKKLAEESKKKKSGDDTTSNISTPAVERQLSHTVSPGDYRRRLDYDKGGPNLYNGLNLKMGSYASIAATKAHKGSENTKNE